jgi:putative hemolysin
MDTKEKKEFINVEKIMKAKAPSLYKKLPRFVINYFIHILHQDEVNSDLHEISDLVGVPKFHKHLAINNIHIDLHGVENIPQDGHFIFASNHPFGGPDGIMIVSAVGKMFNDKAKLMVNDLLMHLPDIEDVFIPINRFGRNKQDYVNVLDSSMQSDSQIIMFPAGLVSRKIKGHIVDLEWKKSFVSYAKRYKRDIVPVFISGQNSNFFYNLANVRTKLGIKTNIEQLYLIDELYKHKNESVSMYFGKPISYTALTSEKTDKEWAESIKQIAYALPKK